MGRLSRECLRSVALLFMAQVTYMYRDKNFDQNTYKSTASKILVGLTIIHSYRYRINTRSRFCSCPPTQPAILYSGAFIMPVTVCQFCYVILSALPKFFVPATRKWCCATCYTQHIIAPKLAA